jgi:hypothetical protein
MGGYFVLSAVRLEDSLKLKWIKHNLITLIFHLLAHKIYFYCVLKHFCKSVLSEVMSVRPCASAWNDPITTGLVLFTFNFWDFYYSFFFTSRFCVTPVKEWETLYLKNTFARLWSHLTVVRIYKLVFLVRYEMRPKKKFM